MLGKLKSKFVNWLLKDVHLDEIHIGEHSVVIAGTGINMDAKKIENVAAPDSDDDAPRRDTIDSKIATHKSDASAHHIKTTEDTVSSAVSDTLRNSNDNEKSTSSSTYVKVKEVKLNEDLPACRLKFDVDMFPTDGNSYAQVYKNGVPIGTEWAFSETGYVTKSEDFTGWVKDDLIQIYLKTPKTAYVQHMRFYYDVVITYVGGWDLITDLPVTYSISMTNQDP